MDEKFAMMEEKVLHKKQALGTLCVLIAIHILALAGWIGTLVKSVQASEAGAPQPFAGIWVILCVVLGIYSFLVGPILYAGFRMVKPNEAMVLTLFGNYYGTVRQSGLFCVHPFAVATPIPDSQANTGKVSTPQTMGKMQLMDREAMQQIGLVPKNRRLSLKVMTFVNDKQKINDKLGNPVIIGIVVTWRIVDTAKAMFAVDNYVEFLSMQCDAALRDVTRQYPYDAYNEDKSLRSSGDEIAETLLQDIQRRVVGAGLEILEARITNLAYAPEIASVMLQRQQASAVVDARTLIVDGAVGMVQMALEKLREEGVVELDEERKAAMVSNLMVVLCGNKEAQPVVNSGSLY
jgi:regulator of protease activity HflC (stomatin/prohibitin superfamily)